MTLRTRNLLIDNTTGTIYTNLTNTAAATKDKIAAGVFPKIHKVTITGPGKNVVVVTANRPVNFGREVLINNVSMSVADSRGRVLAAAAPQGNPITVRLRKRTSAGVESTLGTYSIAQNTTTFSSNVSFSIASTDSLFVDVTATGSTKPGLGLSVTISFFG
jgi:hypothetical protein